VGAFIKRAEWLPNPDVCRFDQDLARTATRCVLQMQKPCQTPASHSGKNCGSVYTPLDVLPTTLPLLEMHPVKLRASDHFRAFGAHARYPNLAIAALLLTAVKLHFNLPFDIRVQ
jgi:hypothetical protein